MAAAEIEIFVVATGWVAGAAKVSTEVCPGLIDAGLNDAARAALRRALGRRLQKRPLVDVHLLRV